MGQLTLQRYVNMYTDCLKNHSSSSCVDLTDNSDYSDVKMWNFYTKDALRLAALHCLVHLNQTLVYFPLSHG